MERQLSRRRRRAISGRSRPETASAEITDGTQKGTKNNQTLVVILILLFVFVLSVFLGYFRSHAVAGLQMLCNQLLRSGINEGHLHPSDNIQEPNPPLQLNIQLHPEEHAGRPTMTHYLRWRVNSGYCRPDGVRKQVFLINGEHLFGFQIISNVMPTGQEVDELARKAINSVCRLTG